MTLQRMDHAGAAPQTTLSAQIGAGDMTVPLVSGAGYPTGGVGPFVIAVDPGQAGEEKILCSSRSGNSCIVATSGRGYDGTTAAIHTQNAPVQHVLSAVEVDDDNAHIYTTTRDDHTQYARTDGTRAFTGGITVTAGGATVTGNVAVTGGLTVSGAESGGSSITGVNFAPTGLTGATAASRYVGATASGAPISGSFAVGDFIVDQTGTVWVCTAAGTPGTWGKVATDGSVVHTTGNETVNGNKTFNGVTALPGGVTGGLNVTGNETVTGTLSATGAMSGSSSITGQDIVATGLTGAVAASRYVGATTSGAPTAGTFSLGDFVIDQGGSVWICTTAGTPGTWTPAGQSLFGAENPLVGVLPAGTVRFLRQKGIKSSTSDGSGNGNIVFKNAFPNGLLHVTADVDFFGTVFPWKLAYGGNPQKGSLGYKLFDTTTGAGVGNTNFSYFYDATGW